MKHENPSWFVEDSIKSYKEQASKFPPDVYPILSAEELEPIHPWTDILRSAGVVLPSGKGKYHFAGANKTADLVPIRVDKKEPMVQLIERTYPEGLWAVPGGFIDEGESGLQAAVREYTEETCSYIQDFNPALLPIYEGPVADTRMTANAWPETSAYLAILDPYRSRLLSTETRVGRNPDEVRSIGWFTLAQVLDKPMFGSHRQMVELAFENL